MTSCTQVPNEDGDQSQNERCLEWEQQVSYRRNMRLGRLSLRTDQHLRSLAVQDIEPWGTLSSCIHSMPSRAKRFNRA